MKINKYKKVYEFRINNEKYEILFSGENPYNSKSRFTVVGI
jgi:hypothetical protein